MLGHPSIFCDGTSISLQNNVQSLCFTIILTFINSAVSCKSAVKSWTSVYLHPFSCFSLGRKLLGKYPMSETFALQIRTWNYHEVASNPCDGTSNFEFWGTFPVSGHLRVGLLIQKGCTDILGEAVVSQVFFVLSTAVCNLTAFHE